MKIFLFRTRGGLIVARTFRHGNEADYSLVAEINIKREGSLLADNPDVQTLLCVAFTEGARWQQKNQDSEVLEWPVE